MADLIPWLFLLPPSLVAIVSVVTLIAARSPRGRADACLRLGGQHLQRKELTQAETLFRKGLEHRPDHPALLGTLGSLLVQLERHDEALPLLERASSASPDDMPLRLVLGRCLLVLGQHDRALERWRTIPAQATVYLDAQGLLAADAEERQDLDAAIAHLEAAITAAPVHDARPLKKDLKRLQDLRAANAESGQVSPDARTGAADSTPATAD